MFNHAAWTCAHCNRPFLRSTFDLVKGDCVPSKEWARAAGFPVQNGKWLPVVRVVTGKLKPPAIKTPALFPDPEDSDLPAGAEDWTA